MQQPFASLDSCGKNPKTVVTYQCKNLHESVTGTECICGGGATSYLKPSRFETSRKKPQSGMELPGSSPLSPNQIRQERHTRRRKEQSNGANQLFLHEIHQRSHWQRRTQRQNGGAKRRQCRGGWKAVRRSERGKTMCSEEGERTRGGTTEVVGPRRPIGQKPRRSGKWQEAEARRLKAMEARN